MSYPTGIGASDKAEVRLARVAESTSIRLIAFPEVIKKSDRHLYGAHDHLDDGDQPTRVIHTTDHKEDKDGRNHHGLHHSWKKFNSLPFRISSLFTSDEDDNADGNGGDGNLESLSRSQSRC